MRDSAINSRSGRLLLCAGVIVLLCASVDLPAQQTSQTSPPATPAQSSSSEMAVKDEATTEKVAEAAQFRVNVRLVLARVVVRDANGHLIGGLHKEDFQIFDNGKPQVISNFDAEHIPPPAPPTSAATSAGSSTPVAPATFPSRYVAYLFDDIRLNYDDLIRVRQAAQRRMADLVPTDRTAVFTTSGQTVLDFTDDRAKLQQTLDAIRPHPLQVTSQNDCPSITFYMADLIVNKRDQEARQAAINDYIVCANIPAQMVASAGTIVEGMATQVLNVGQEESRVDLRTVKDIVRRMSALPGQRSLIFVSPGFLTPELEYDYSDLIDRSLRAQIVISSLDPRGLYVVIPFGDASQAGRPERSIPGQPATPGARTMYATSSALAEGEILRVLANETGGNSFQNNNDMDEGFRRLADSPEYYYIIGFTPQNLKSDGKFHTLKVSLTNHQKYELQSRRGYYAPRHDVDAAEQAKREIDDEVFSSEELHDLPVALHTEFFKATDDLAKLTVLARVDVKRLHYKQADNRSCNDVTLVTAVFDRNGNFLQADQKVLQMHWKPETLQARLGSGVTLKSSFDVKPGRYLVRVVARDAEQQVMSAENGAVEIP